jgi:hypothetical protein
MTASASSTSAPTPPTAPAAPAWCRRPSSTSWWSDPRHSGGQSREATGAAASNLDLYQVNCTFYDALGRDDGAYLIARAIQFFLPGVPQVYYVGLLAGENDMALLQPQRRGPRHQPPPLQPRRDRCAPAAPGGAAAAAADPPAQQPSGIRGWRGTWGGFGSAAIAACTVRTLSLSECTHSRPAALATALSESIGRAYGCARVAA